MKRVTVFCGSSPGHHPSLIQSAYQLGQQLATLNMEVVYGGANVGMMGAVADGALANGGQVIGVLPRFLQTKEIAHQNLTELIWVESMHERKLKMNDLSDGVIALPGGYGTLEEYFEMLTWGQLGLHKKPVALLNLNGYYDGLLTLADTMVVSGLLKPANRAMMLVGQTTDDLINQMLTYQPPSVGKWIVNSDV